MEPSNLPLHPKTTALADGWRLVQRFDGDNAVFLEFQRDGRMGPRVSGSRATFDDALQMGRDWMERYDERDWQRRR